jgi:hypothetical protein
MKSSFVNASGKLAGTMGMTCIVVASFFASCSKEELIFKPEEPKVTDPDTTVVEKPKPLILDTVYYYIQDIDQLAQKSAEIDEGISTNDPKKSRVSINLTGNLGLKDDEQKDWLNKFNEWGAKTGSDGVIVVTNSKIAYNGGGVKLRKTEYDNLTRAVGGRTYVNLGIGPNGEQFVTTTLSELMEFTDAGLGWLVFLYSDNGNSNSDFNIVARNDGELLSKLDSVILVANDGKSVRFSMNGVFNLQNNSQNPHIARLEEIYKLMDQGKEITTSTDNAMVGPGETSTRIDDVVKFRQNFKNIRKAEINGISFFYALRKEDEAADGKIIDFANYIGAIKTDRASVTEIESGRIIGNGGNAILIPEELQITEDLVNGQTLENAFKNYNGQIKITPLPSETPERTAGGLNRMYNFDPSAFSTPYSRALGESNRKFSYTVDDPVLGFYKPENDYNSVDESWARNTKHIGESRVLRGFTLDALHGNFGVEKFTKSNQIAKVWAKTNSPTGEALAMLGCRIDGKNIVYTVNYPTDDERYMWRDEPYGIVRNGPIISKKTFVNDVLIGAFDLPESSPPELAIQIGIAGGSVNIAWGSVTEEEYDGCYDPTYGYLIQNFTKIFCGNLRYAVDFRNIMPVRESLLSAAGKRAR